MATETKKEQLREWMRGRDITLRAISEKIGLATNTVSILLNSSHMPSKHHAEFVRLGFPVELLPVPLDKKPGRKPLEARFPVDETSGQ